MINKIIHAIVFTLFLCSPIAIAGNNLEDSLSFSLTDKREVITRDIDNKLLLRAVKSGNLGWDVEVHEKASNVHASNLLYHSQDWHGPYPSQIYAWHVANKYFPNERKLEIRGYLYEVKIILKDAIIEGQGSEARFVSGNVNIVWRRKL